MMRHEESMQRQFRQEVELGRDNQTCISGMRRWCKHAEIELTSSGVYAEITGLPIASHTVSCPYVNAKTGGMDLRRILSDFLTQHCAGCPHHSPNGDPSWGQEIIDAHVAQEKQNQHEVNETRLRIQQLRSELRNRSASMTSEATPEARSVLSYLETVFSDCAKARNRASEQIRQAALLGADLLPNEAASLIITLATTLEYSESMLPVCTALAATRPDLADELIKAALANIEKRLYVE